LFDSELKLQNQITLSPNTRFVLLDLDAKELGQRSLLAAGCRAVVQKETPNEISVEVEGVANTPGVVFFILRAPRAPSN
jgi:hypothetical protein